jgi:outer membrane lipoprotein-sorting protein
MKICRSVLAAGAIVLGTLGAISGNAQSPTSTTEDAGEERLRRVLGAVAAQPLNAAPFVERRTSALFATPQESRGTLSYRPPGTVEKRTTSPIRETLSMTADTVTIDSGTGAPPTVVKVDASQGQLASYVSGLRAILSGDDRLLRQVFDTRLTGSFDNWTLQLLPKGPLPRRGIRKIVVSGTGAHLRQIETTEINGDVLDMAITTR